MSQLEYLENPANYKLSALPIQHKDLYEMYKKAQASFWVEEEINSELDKDKPHWDSFSDDIRHFITRILAFFAVSDGVVGETVQEELLSRVQIREAKLWYNYQLAMEDIHNLVYSKLVDTYITNSAEKKKVLDAVTSFPTIAKKIEWVKRWIGADNDLNGLADSSRKIVSDLVKTADGVKRLFSDLSPSSAIVSDPTDYKKFTAKLQSGRTPLAKVVFVNAIMEGVFFSGSFCAIFWIGHNYKKLPGLTKANEFISRDEGSHTLFATHLYNNYIEKKLSDEEAHKIMREAVEIETQFICEALPDNLPGMNSKLMTAYVQFVADQLLSQMKYEKIFNVEQPFPFMEKQSLSVRMTDFFNDLNVTEYKHFASGLKSDDFKLDFSEDF